MLSKVYSVTNYGLRPSEIEVEVNVASKGFPTFTIVGMPEKSSSEAKERIKTAIINTGIEFPMAKITVNVAPADFPKEGSVYDLPIAIGILNAINEVKLPSIKSYFYGELALDGSLRHSRGVFLLALLAREQGIGQIFVPRVCANEASVFDNLKLFPVDSLKSLLGHLRGDKIMPLKYVDRAQLLGDIIPEFDFSEIRGQEMAKRALEIAAAGGHNTFMIGPPGSGKTMLARAAAGILPSLTEPESLEVTKIFSITGNIPAGGSLIRTRPFRSPHHTTSMAGLIGGGSIPRPGEVSLAHRGILFLDEFPEFSRTALEALRQPLEDGEVSISRVAGSLQFPAKFMLIAAANPCPCGFLGDPKKECKCNSRQILNYQNKLSGPIMDRIDLHLTVPMVEVNKLFKSNQGAEKSIEIKKRIENARNIQSKRFAGIKGVYCNSDMRNRHLADHVRLGKSGNLILKQAVNRYSLSARTYFRLIKVARTIADLDNSREINDNHVAEALQFRVRN